MNRIKKSLYKLTQSSTNHGNLLTYVHNKANAKLGDSLINFIYSIAKSIVAGTPTGIKVSDSILSEAYKCSQWSKTNILKLTGNKGHIADSVEALVLYFWLHETMSLEKLVEPLTSHLEADQLHHPKEERKSAIHAFQHLLNNLFQVYTDKEKIE